MKTILIAIFLMSATAGAQNASGNADNGKRLWVKDNCYSCHGFEGHGGAGPKLAPKPIPAVAFISIVRRPPASSMPAFTAKIISDADLRDMWTYLNSLPATMAVKDIPLLNE